MSFGQIILAYWQMWALGLAMIFFTFRSEHRDLLRITWKTVGKWCLFLGALSIYRYAMFHFYPAAFGNVEAVLWIPWQMTLTVFWEDAAYVLPLLLMERFLPKKWWTRPLMTLLIGFMMLSFGLGHVYQGNFAAIMLSLYIPMGLRVAREKGIGTMMVNHVLYDLTTLLMIQYVVRTMM